MRLRILFFIIFLGYSYANATQILVYMGEKQKNHLKAYGIAYWVIEKDVSIEWLLNYRGGSFLIPHLVTIEEELMIRGVSYQILTEGQVTQIKNEIANPEVNMEVIQLEKPPKIAVYTPPNKQPWDDAVTMVLEYAEIPYDKIYDSSIVMASFQNMIGFTFIMKTSLDNMVSSTDQHVTKNGIKSKLRLPREMLAF